MTSSNKTLPFFSKLSESRWTAWLFIIGLLIANFSLGFPQTFYGVPFSIYPDSFKTVGVALTLAREWKIGHFVLDPMNYQYPTFYTYILAVCFFFSKKIYYAEQYGRVISLLASTLTIPVIFLIGRRIRNVQTGIIGAIFVAFGFIFVYQGRYPSADSLQMLCFSLGLFFILKNKITQTRQFLFSGFFIGLGVGTKYTAIIFFLPILATIFLFSLTSPRQIFSQVKSWSLWGVSMLCGFILTTPTLLTKFGQYYDRMQFERLVQKSGGISITPPRFWDYLFLTQPIDQEFFFPQSVLGGMGMTFTLMGVIALIWQMVDSWNKKKEEELGIILAIILSYIYFSIASKIHVIRFMLIFVLMVCLVLSLFIDEIGQAVSRFSNHKVRASIVIGLLTMMIFIPNLGRSLDYLKALSKPDTRVLAAEWIFKNIPPEEKTLIMFWDPALPSKYNAVQWPFPIYPFELDSPDAFAPSIERLRAENISCVVWNGTFKNNLEGPYESERIEAHQKQWKQFYADLNRLKNPDRYFEVIGEISSSIQIFCPEKKDW